MNPLLLNSVFLLSGIGITSAAILYLVATRFRVEEDPKIDEVESVLPGANCGGCGFAGCRNFAEAVVRIKDLEKLNCPVCGIEGMKKVAEVVGLTAPEREPMVAVLRCNGTKGHAPRKLQYQGISNCSHAHSLGAGEHGCSYGCLGLGDCVRVCQFDALYTDPILGIPVVIEDKCTSCGACVDICPRQLFELRPRGELGRVYVACMNQEKGAVAKKNCSVACIGCAKCLKVAQFEHVKVNNFLSYIDPKVDIFRFGHDLVECCPTNAIIGINLPPKNTTSETTPR